MRLAPSMYNFAGRIFPEGSYLMPKIRVCNAARMLLFLTPSFSLLAQSGTANGEWRYYGGDAQSTKYSPLDQINRDNVGKLQIAWTWKAQNFGPRADPNYEVTPLAVHGVLYFTAGMRRDTVAVDAATGETLWMYRLDEGDARRSRGALQQSRRRLLDRQSRRRADSAPFRSDIS